MTLSPTGRIGDAVGLFDGEAAWVFADVGFGQPLVDFLMSVRFMMRVGRRFCEDLAILGGYGAAQAALAPVARRELVSCHGGVGGSVAADGRHRSATYGPADAEHGL